MSQTITIPTVRVTFKSLGVKVATNKAVKKIVEGVAIQMVNRAVTRWFYS